jgi:uncharacterized membrane protein
MSTWSEYTRRMTRGAGVERLTFFSDAVFAIAMTLLVVELGVPEVPTGELAAALLELVPRYLTFVLSFVVVGMIWLSHHRKFRVIVRVDPVLLRLNLVMLLFVASLPWPTALLGRYGGTTVAAVIYAATIAAIGFTLTALWMVAWHRGLIDDLPVGVFRLVLVQSFPIPGIFLLSIPATLIGGATAGEFTWIAAIPISAFATLAYRRAVDRPSAA